MPHRLSKENWSRYELLTLQSQGLLKKLWLEDKEKYIFFQNEINKATTDTQIASLLVMMAVYLKKRREYVNK